mmetsp:Transcript_4381/g.15710  ORF Transcript_4381/g.15710 Transcript_4381/m.15710 type:complete len:223 (-) Transcript_4381:156-824(-)
MKILVKLVIFKLLCISRVCVASPQSKSQVSLTLLCTDISSASEVTFLFSVGAPPLVPRNVSCRPVKLRALYRCSLSYPFIPFICASKAILSCGLTLLLLPPPPECFPLPECPCLTPPTSSDGELEGDDDGVAKESWAALSRADARGVTPRGWSPSRAHAPWRHQTRGSCHEARAAARPTPFAVDLGATPILLTTAPCITVTTTMANHKTQKRTTGTSQLRVR